MCKHPDVQKRLRTEILASDLPITENEGNNGAEALDSLPYLRAVTQEILRLMPAVPITRREALRDTTVQGYVVPKDGHIVSSGWVVNRLDTQWGPDAEAFAPHRWLGQDKNNEGSSRGAGNAYAFASFSHGPRSCIGQGFARGEFQVFLAALLGSFEMQLANPEKEPEALFGVTMSPAGGIEVSLRALK